MAPINPAKSEKIEKIEWSAVDDRKILILTLGRIIPERELPIIAKSFAQNPSVDQLKERLAYLRQKSKQLLEKHGMLEGRGSKTTAKTEESNELEAAKVVGKEE